MRFLHSILDKSSEIEHNIDDILINELIIKWATTEGGLRSQFFDSGVIKYDEKTHTIIFNKIPAKFTPTIEDVTKTSPNLTWTVCDNLIYKPLHKDLYSLGISVRDIHVQMPNTLTTMYYVGDFSERKECVDAKNIESIISFGIVGLNSGKNLLNDDYQFNYENLNNLKYILPNTQIMYCTLPYVDLMIEMEGLNIWTINTYNTFRLENEGLKFGGDFIFQYDHSTRHIRINQVIDEDLLLKYVKKFAKLNPSISNITTTTGPGFTCTLLIKESLLKNEILFNENII